MEPPISQTSMPVSTPDFTIKKEQTAEGGITPTGKLRNGRSATRLEIKGSLDQKTLLIAAKTANEFKSQGGFKRFIDARLTVKLTIVEGADKQEMRVNIRSVAKRLGVSQSEVKEAASQGKLSEFLTKKATIMGNYQRIVSNMEKMGLQLHTQQHYLSKLLDVVSATVGEFSRDSAKTEYDPTIRGLPVNFHAKRGETTSKGELVISLTAQRFLGQGAFGVAIHTVNFEQGTHHVEKQAQLNPKGFAAVLIEDKRMGEFSRQAGYSDQFRSSIDAFIKNSDKPNALTVLINQLSAIPKGNTKDYYGAQKLLKDIDKPTTDLGYEQRNLQMLNEKGPVMGIQEIPQPKDHKAVQVVPEFTGSPGKLTSMNTTFYDLGDYQGCLNRAGGQNYKGGGKKVVHEAYQLIRGLAYAHSKDFIHGDIKPENIMCKSSNDPKFAPDVAIADWGGSRNESLDAITTPSASTPFYLKGNEKASKAGDVYALGKVILERIVGGVLPPNEMKESKIRELMGFFDFPKDFIDLIVDMTVNNNKPENQADSIATKLTAFIKNSNPPLAKKLNLG